MYYTHQAPYLSEYWKLAKEEMLVIREEWKKFSKSAEFPSIAEINNIIDCQLHKSEIIDLLWQHHLSSLCLKTTNNQLPIDKINPIYHAFNDFLKPFNKHKLQLPTWNLTKESPDWFVLLSHEPSILKKNKLLQSNPSIGEAIINSLTETIINFVGGKEVFNKKITIEEWGTEGYFAQKYDFNNALNISLTTNYLFLPAYYKSIFLSTYSDVSNIKSVFPQSLDVENFQKQLNLFKPTTAEIPQPAEIILSQLPLPKTKSQKTFFDTYFKLPNGTATDDYQLLYHLEKNQTTLKASCIIVDPIFFYENEYFWDYLRKIGDCWIVDIKEVEYTLLIWKPSIKGKVYQSNLSFEHLALLPTAHIANLSPIENNPWLLLQSKDSFNRIKIWDGNGKGLFLKKFPCVHDTHFKISPPSNVTINIQDFPFLPDQKPLEAISAKAFQESKMVWHELNNFYSKALVVRYAPDQLKTHPTAYLPTLNIIGGKGVTDVFPLSWKNTGDNITDHALGRFRAYYHEYYGSLLNQNTSIVNDLLSQLKPFCKKLPAINKRFVELENRWIEMRSKENNQIISDALEQALLLLEQKAFQIGRGAIDKKVLFEQIFRLTNTLKKEIKEVLEFRAQAYLRYNEALNISKEDIFNYTSSLLLFYRENENIGNTGIPFMNTFYQHSSWGKDAFECLIGKKMLPMTLNKNDLQPGNFEERKWLFKVKREERSFYLDDSFVITELPNAIFDKKINGRNVFDIWRKKAKVSVKDTAVTFALLEKFCDELSSLCSCIESWEQLLNQFNQYEDLPQSKMQ